MASELNSLAKERCIHDLKVKVLVVPSCLTLWSHGLYVAHQAPLYMEFSWFSVLRFKPVGSCAIDIDCVRVLKSHAFFPCTFCGDMLTSKYMPFKILIFQHRAFSVVGWYRIHLLCGNTGLIPGLGRSPGEGNGNPLQCSCLKSPMDGGAKNNLYIVHLPSMEA